MKPYSADDYRKDCGTSRARRPFLHPDDWAYVAYATLLAVVGCAPMAMVVGLGTRSAVDGWVTYVMLIGGMVGLAVRLLRS